MSDRSGRSPAEWVTFALCSLVLAAVVVLIVVEVRGPNDAPAPSATVTSPARPVGDGFQVDVAVTNDGDLTAANVQVSAELTPPDGSSPTAGDQTIDFLAGHEEQDLVFVFPDDPAAGELTVAVTSFAAPCSTPSIDPTGPPATGGRSRPQRRRAPADDPAISRR